MAWPVMFQIIVSREIKLEKKTVRVVGGARRLGWKKGGTKKNIRMKNIKRKTSLTPDHLQANLINSRLTSKKSKISVNGQSPHCHPLRSPFDYGDYLSAIFFVLPYWRLCVFILSSSDVITIVLFLVKYFYKIRSYTNFHRPRFQKIKYIILPGRRLRRHSYIVTVHTNH